jgi:hypothetical protein
MASRMKKPGYQFPQLGTDLVPRQVMTRAGEPRTTNAGNPMVALANQAVDLSDPNAVKSAKRNIIHSIDTASPEMVEFGRQWYPRVSEAVSKGVQGRGFLGGQFDKHLAGAALVAAVSPNMDWDRNNIDAFKEMKSIKSAGWKKIMAGGDDAADVYKGMSISAAPLANIQKAGRIIAGEDPESVVSYASAPKTHSFMQNIHQPDAGQFVTIDGRAMDTLSNRMIPWGTGRGIGGSQTAKNPPARYLQAAGLYQDVAHDYGLDPSAAQAISWSNVKYDVERAGGRKQGPGRIGQPYFDPETGANASRDPAFFAAHRGRMQQFYAGLGA